MVFEIFGQIAAFLVKWLGMIIAGIYDLLTATVPKFFVFAWEIVQRFVSWVISSYVEFKAMLKWHAIKKPRILKTKGKIIIKRK